MARPAHLIDAVDVGAGTGVWTRTLTEAGFRSVVAVEPTQAMREIGARDSGDQVRWLDGTGEHTSLPDNCVDLLTAASCFHWMDFDGALAEAYRVLRCDGWLVALWNPRIVEANPLLAEIEAELFRIAPSLRRQSSGRSGMTERLRERLEDSPLFTDVLFVESHHVFKQSPSHYLGAWWSANDVRAQLTHSDFLRFIDYVHERLDAIDFIDVTYATRTWAARRTGPRS